MAKVFTDEMSQDICERIMDEFNKKFANSDEDYDEEFIFELIKKVPKEKINYYNFAGYTFLTCAVHRKNLEMVKYLLNNGINVNGTTEINPLIYAMWCNETEITEILLEYNADVNLKDDDGDTIVSAIFNNSNVEEL